MLGGRGRRDCNDSTNIPTQPPHIVPWHLFFIKLQRFQFHLHFLHKMTLEFPQASVQKFTWVKNGLILPFFSRHLSQNAIKEWFPRFNKVRFSKKWGKKPDQVMSSVKKGKTNPHRVMCFFTSVYINCELYINQNKVQALGSVLSWLNWKVSSSWSQVDFLSWCSCWVKMV